MESSKTKLLHGILLALAVGAASFVGTKAAVATAPAGAADHAAVLPAADQAQILAVLQSIETQLKERPLQAPSAVPGRSTLMAEQEGAQLASVLDKLMVQLARMESANAGAAAGATAAAAEMREKDMAAVASAAAVPEADFDKAHSLMTTAQLVERFGRPDFIRPSPTGGGDKWRYILNDEKTLIFWVKDGRVASAFYDP